MRADRLLSILMILQSRGNTPARSLACELEVSERTIYRDVQALSSAGIPVYTDRGPHGGISLVESYRTNLTGLTNAEVEALFMVSIPAPLTQLGVSQELKGALLKLAAALPGSQRAHQAQARQRIHLDSAWWFQGSEALPHLQTLQQGVWNDRKLYLKQRLPFFADVDQVVCPYGLVAKTNVWYLVCAREGRLRVIRVAEIIDARLLEEGFSRPLDFDLAAFWQTWCAHTEQQRLAYLARVRIAPTLLPHLPSILEKAISQQTPDAQGWVTLTLRFESLEDARQRLLTFGSAAEILEPEELRLSVLDYAEQIVSFYRAKSLASPSRQTPE